MTPIRTMLPVVGFLLATPGGALAISGGALAISGGIVSSGPDCALTSKYPEWRSVWLGHFAGGRYVVGETTRRALDWQDQYSCFASQAACQSWQRSMRRSYHAVEGYRTCLPIRSGPLRDRPTWESPPPSQD